MTAAAANNTVHTRIDLIAEISIRHLRDAG
jgi:hypothetical protein